ncbi:MAG: hypothetical protein K8R18_02135 [Parvibaculum sp.]|uniref:hypothetical protein n=1 Tax=Parvibaculum sp. TaxID=2024848 RepID=UPI0025EFBC2B|nr:hypothetical protein [Parvibaculum sp.]MCE9648399.1 hypothetical protein [Parvibaculum sp.]
MSVRVFLFLGFFAAAIGGLAAASSCPPAHSHAAGAETVAAATDADAAASGGRQCHHNRPSAEAPLAALARATSHFSAPLPSPSPQPVAHMERARFSVFAPRPAFVRLRRDADRAHDAAYARTGRLLI